MSLDITPAMPVIVQEPRDVMRMAMMSPYRVWLMAVVIVLLPAVVVASIMTLSPIITIVPGFEDVFAGAILGSLNYMSLVPINPAIFTEPIF
jgi:cellulose synthase/poly-beta-1,6-N-acetylglucosamine synthase-like glycosyltransferase